MEKTKIIDMDIFYDLINNENYKVQELEKNVPEFYLDNRKFRPEKLNLEMSYTDEKLKKMSLTIVIQNHVSDFLIHFSSKFNLNLDDNLIHGSENSSVNLTLIPKKFIIEKFETKLIKMENIEEIFGFNEDSNTFLKIENYDIDDFRIIQEE